MLIRFYAFIRKLFRLTVYKVDSYRINNSGDYQYLVCWACGDEVLVNQLPYPKTKVTLIDGTFKRPFRHLVFTCYQCGAINRMAAKEDSERAITERAKLEKE